MCYLYEGLALVRVGRERNESEEDVQHRVTPEVEKGT